MAVGPATAQVRKAALSHTECIPFPSLCPLTAAAAVAGDSMDPPLTCGRASRSSAAHRGSAREDRCRLGWREKTSICSGGEDRCRLGWREKTSICSGGEDRCRLGWREKTSICKAADRSVIWACQQTKCLAVWGGRDRAQGHMSRAE